MASALYIGDCIEVMQTLPHDSADMLFTDLPYGTTRCRWDTPIDLRAFWMAAQRVVKSDGCIALCCGRCGEVDYSPITESGEDVAKRLAAYEDICFDADGKERITVEELSALVKARDEGRVVELDTPRKPLVWGDDDHETCLCPDCGADLMGIPYGERMILQCPVCGQYVDTTEAITRAEAEAVQCEEGQDG